MIEPNDAKARTQVFGRRFGRPPAHRREYPVVARERFGPDEAAVELGEATADGAQQRIALGIAVERSFNTERSYIEPAGLGSPEALEYRRFVEESRARDLDALRAGTAAVGELRLVDAEDPDMMASPEPQLVAENLNARQMALLDAAYRAARCWEGLDREMNVAIEELNGAVGSTGLNLPLTHVAQKYEQMRFGYREDGPLTLRNSWRTASDLVSEYAAVQSEGTWEKIVGDPYASERDQVRALEDAYRNGILERPGVAELARQAVRGDGAAEVRLLEMRAEDIDVISRGAEAAGQRNLTPETLTAYAHALHAAGRAASPTGKLAGAVEGLETAALRDVPPEEMSYPLLGKIVEAHHVGGLVKFDNRVPAQEMQRYEEFVMERALDQARIDAAGDREVVQPDRAVVLTGELHRQPRLGHLEGGLASSTLTVLQGRTDERVSNQPVVKAFIVGKVAEKAVQTLQEGDRVVLVGRMEPEQTSIDPETQQEKKRGAFFATSRVAVDVAAVPLQVDRATQAVERQKQFDRTYSVLTGPESGPSGPN